VGFGEGIVFQSVFGALDVDFDKSLIGFGSKNDYILLLDQAQKKPDGLL